MYPKSKLKITCPKCGGIANQLLNLQCYICSDCNWSSQDNTVDIFYGDELSAPLSNLFSHPFTFNLGPNDSFTKCQSMESFLQSLKVRDPEIQQDICNNYSGYTAHKLKLTLPDWRESGVLYWDLCAIPRDSKAYDELITTAYDCLFETNAVFRQIVLPRFKGMFLIHSIGCDDKSKTLLTEQEYIFQLNRLMKRLENY